MNVEAIKKLLDLKDNAFFRENEEILEPFIRGYVKKNCKSDFKLLGRYIFRPEVYLPRIAERYPDIFLCDASSIDYDDPDLASKIDMEKLKKVIEKYGCSIYVGKISFNKRLTDFFLSINEKYIDGFTVFADKSDPYFSGLHLDLGTVSKKHILTYSDLKDELMKIVRRTTDYLDEL